MADGGLRPYLSHDYEVNGQTIDIHCYKQLCTSPFLKIFEYIFDDLLKGIVWLNLKLLQILVGPRIFDKDGA